MVSPEKLINADGQPYFGRFDKPVADINFADFDLRTPMGKSIRRNRGRYFNQFQFIGIHSERLIVGIAIVKLRWVSHAFLYLYDKEDGHWQEQRFTHPLRLGLVLGQKPNNSTTAFRSGRNRMVIRATTRPGIRQLRVSLKDGTRIRATIDESTHYHPLSVCTRTGFTGFTYTQKSNARVCHGRIHWQGRDYDLESERALAGVDWSGGYMRRETAWNWASMSVRLHDGRRLGLNIAAGVNETGYNENGLWLDDRLYSLPPVHFRFDRYHPGHGWALTSEDDSVRLYFDPVTAYRDKVNAGIIASNFSQFLGRYSGEIDVAGETLHIDRLWGVAEDHYARW